MISIIVPVYNSARYLRRCLDSLKAQSYGGLEIILVDDGSTDGSDEICDEYAAGDSRFKVIHKQNTGVADTRNQGLDAAAGDYIGFVDSDDYAEPDMFYKLRENIDKYDADICTCGYYEENEDGSNRSAHSIDGDVKLYEGADEAYSALFGYNSGIGSGNWNKLFRREVIGTLRFESYVVGEDVEFQCRVIHNIKRMVSITTPLYHYLHNEGNATGSFFRPQSMDIIKVVDSLLEFIRKEHPTVLDSMYAYHLTWYMATVQVMYWSKNVRPYKREMQLLRESLKRNRFGYSGNPRVYKLDRVLMHAFLLHCFRPVYTAYKAYKGLQGEQLRG